MAGYENEIAIVQAIAKQYIEDCCSGKFLGFCGTKFIPHDNIHEVEVVIDFGGWVKDGMEMKWHENIAGWVIQISAKEKKVLGWRYPDGPEGDPELSGVPDEPTDGPIIFDDPLHLGGSSSFGGSSFSKDRLLNKLNHKKGLTPGEALKIRKAILEDSDDFHSQMSWDKFLDSFD